MQTQPLSLDEKCKKLEETIQRAATNTIGYTRKQANKAARECAIQIKTKQRSQACLTTSPELAKNCLKARQFNEEASIDSRKFNKRLNDVRRAFKPQVAMCRAKNGELLTKKNQVLPR
jgi:hypothetical protein